MTLLNQAAPKSQQIWFYPPPTPSNDLFHQAVPTNYSDVRWYRNHKSSSFILNIDRWQSWQEVSRIVSWAFSCRRRACLCRSNRRWVRIGSRWWASSLERGRFIATIWRSIFCLWSRGWGGICFEGGPLGVTRLRCICFCLSRIEIRSSFSRLPRLPCRFGLLRLGRRICPVPVTSGCCSSCF